MPTFSIHTLGCRTNQADSEQLRQILLGAGFVEVPFGSPADCAIVNTCTVTGEADRKSRQILRRASRQAGTVVATGCGVARRGGLQSLPGAVLELAPESREQILELLGASDCPGGSALRYGLQAGRSRALLKVQEGCDHFCSYCIVPYVRGRSRSMPASSLVEQARALEEAGHREIVLTGIHLAVWGRDLPENPDLADLLDRLLRGTREVRFRLSSIEPMSFPHRILERMACFPDRICPHLHLPLQHASDAILKRMRRDYTWAEYDRLARDFLDSVPGACLTTDILVGFPGETQGDFEILMGSLRTLPFLHLHVFAYSPRKGTAAAMYSDPVPEATRKSRSEQVIRLGERLARAVRRRFRGQVRPVLVERAADREGEWLGTADNFLQVCFPGPPALLGRIVPVRLGLGEDGRLCGLPKGEEFASGR